jgi:phenylacetate-CoA ligase
VTAAQLEELIFGLPAELGVMFWRAKAGRERLRLEFEAPAEHGCQARDLLVEALARHVAAPTEVKALRPGTLVPREVLTGAAELVKPRSLFGPDEDWDRALLYY